MLKTFLRLSLKMCADLKNPLEDTLAFRETHVTGNYELNSFFFNQMYVTITIKVPEINNIRNTKLGLQ